MRLLVAVIVLVAAVYLAAFVFVVPYAPRARPPVRNDPCTEKREDGSIHRYGSGYSCPCPDPCGYCECREGVCTLQYVVPKRHHVTSLVIDDHGFVSLLAYDDGCKPGRYTGNITLHCIGKNYYSEVNATMTIERNETASVTLPDQWIDRIDERLECYAASVDDSDISWTATLHGATKVLGCDERSVDPDTGALVAEPLPDGTPCMATVLSVEGMVPVRNLIPGLCKDNFCGPDDPAWWSPE